MMSVAAIEKMILMNMESDMKELPGQSEIFEGKPMFQQLYHQIVPTESREENRDKNKKTNITQKLLSKVAS